VVVAGKADLNWKLKISNNGSVRLDWGRSSKPYITHKKWEH